ncbi:MAG: hypothetical protein U0930_04340 [Pirellulales bacterium]
MTTQNDDFMVKVPLHTTKLVSHDIDCDLTENRSGEAVQREGEELVELARKLRHEDPVTHEPGCHAVGTGIGAVVGGATVGATTGAILGPAGTVIGTVVGAVVGGLAGKSMNEQVDPTVELVFWKGAYHTRHYYNPDRPFEQYEFAYRLGVEQFDTTHAKTFAEAEPAMKKKWEDLQVWEDEGGAPPMTWEEAKLAAQDSFERLRDRERTV